MVNRIAFANTSCVFIPYSILLENEGLTDSANAFLNIRLVPRPEVAVITIPK